MTNKNTVQEELEELRSKVENLKNTKNQIQDTATKELENIETTVKDFLDKDNINELIVRIKKDYENMSPVTAVGLFALGVIFARVISRK